MSTLHPLSSSFSCTFSPPLVLLLLLPLSSSSFSFSPGRWRTMPVEKVRVWRRCRGGWLLCSATTQTDGAERSEVTENPWHHTHTHTGAWNPFSFFLIARLLMTVFPMNVLKVLLTDFDKKNIFYQSSSEICLFWQMHLVLEELCSLLSRVVIKCLITLEILENFLKCNWPDLGSAWIVAESILIIIIMFVNN